MASSWESYYLVLLSGLLSLVLPISLAMISWFSFRRKSKNSLGSLNQTVLGQKINVRFFLAANAALVLFSLGLELVPCATTLQNNYPSGVLKGLVAILSIAGFSVLGLLYAIRKGDMSWLDSFERKR